MITISACPTISDKEIHSYWFYGQASGYSMFTCMEHKSFGPGHGWYKSPGPCPGGLHMYSIIMSGPDIMLWYVQRYSDHVQRTWTWINLQGYVKVSCYSGSRNNKSMVFEPSYTMVATFMSRNSGLTLHKIKVSCSGLVTWWITNRYYKFKLK